MAGACRPPPVTRAHQSLVEATERLSPQLKRPFARPALRCRCPDADAPDHAHGETVSASLEAAERPHVDVSTPAVCGSVRLLSASGGLESIWLKPRDGDGKNTTFAMLTPDDARALAALLVRYADTHRETPE